MAPLELTQADEARLLQASTTGPELGTSEQDQRIRKAIEATQPPPPPPPGVLHLELDAAKTGVIAVSAPAGTVEIHWADCVASNGDSAPAYHELPFSDTTPHVPSAGKPFVDAQTIDEKGNRGPWWSSTHPRIDVSVEPAKETQAEREAREKREKEASEKAQKEREQREKEGHGLNLCLPGVCMNGGEAPSVRAAKAKALGAKLLRDEDSFAVLTEAALEAGAQAVPIVEGIVPVAEWDKLDTAHKAAFKCACGKNESWPGGIGAQMSGRAYGEWFVARVKEIEGRFPFTCQVNLTPTNTLWMVELMKVPGLAAALVGNYLDHHPYGLSMMIPLANPGNPFDQSHGWESRRFMSEAWVIQKTLGVAIPSFLSELGGSLNHAPNWAQVVIEDTATFQFLEMVKHGTVPVAERPGGAAYIPEVVGMTQYSLLGNRKGYETFGIDFYDAEGGPNEEAGRWKNWKSEAAVLFTS